MTSAVAQGSALRTSAGVRVPGGGHNIQLSARQSAVAMPLEIIAPTARRW